MMPIFVMPCCVLSAHDLCPMTWRLDSMGTHVAFIFRDYFTHILGVQVTFIFPWVFGVQGLIIYDNMLHTICLQSSRRVHPKFFLNQRGRPPIREDRFDGVG